MRSVIYLFVQFDFISIKLVWKCPIGFGFCVHFDFKGVRLHLEGVQFDAKTVLFPISLNKNISDTRRWHARIVNCSNPDVSLNPRLVDLPSTSRFITVSRPVSHDRRVSSPPREKERRDEKKDRRKDRWVPVSSRKEAANPLSGNVIQNRSKLCFSKPPRK